MRAFYREILGTLVLALIIFFLLQTAVQSFVIVYSSMEPSLKEGQRLLVNKAVYFFQEPKRGDIIVFRLPDNPKVDYIKRIIAIPGDTIEVKESVVYVNGSPLTEPYVKAPPRYTTLEQEIPEDNYFVLGDNRNNSLDSHNDWTVPRQNIIGKAWLSYWPLSEWGFVPRYLLQEQLVSSEA
jgi:signal peptidase I